MCFWISTKVVYLHWVLAWLVPQQSAARERQSQCVLCTPYNHALCHFMQSHICKVYACLAVTCHLCFWQNDRGLLCATVVTIGWNGYRNKSQHRKLTLEKKILPQLQRGFEPATFRSRVRRSNHWAIPAPLTWQWLGVWLGSNYEHVTFVWSLSSFHITESCCTPWCDCCFYTNCMCVCVCLLQMEVYSWNTYNNHEDHQGNKQQLAHPLETEWKTKL